MLNNVYYAPVKVNPVVCSFRNLCRFFDDIYQCKPTQHVRELSSLITVIYICDGTMSRVSYHIWIKVTHNKDVSFSWLYSIPKMFVFFGGLCIKPYCRPPDKTFLTRHA